MQSVIGKREYRIILPVVLLVILLSAAGFFLWGQFRGDDSTGWQEHNGRPRKFGATYMTMNNPYFQDLNAKIEEIVEANGDILIYRDPSQNQQKQNEQIMDMLEEGITALFLNPVDWKEVKPALIACKEAGVPIFTIDTNVYDDEYVAFTIVSDNYNAGVQCAEDMMRKRKRANILIIDSPGTNSINDRVQGFLDTIAGNDNYKVIMRECGQGELEVSMDVMNQIIASGEDFNVVLGGNDPTALGVLAALQMNNMMQKRIMIYGIDGSPDGKVMIKEGYIEGSSAQQPMVIAATACDMAYDYLAGKEVDPYVVVPVTMITRSNIDQFDLAGWQ
ncbi:MAG: sugar ABC transporter substrate-binding protein [Lachnospiraceae bacterium]|nr:sugar ABC transporter substrate-binding protein [Lachnospiraceae bacterium]MDD7148805.1 sugar ABC transporter substrate-binding protein [Lachnospiraceae bacterium]MDY4068266.1 sugar ABC transporter substrate-binding protein [Lachnospiraceae bacterium]